MPLYTRPSTPVERAYRLLLSSVVAFYAVGLIVLLGGLGAGHWRTALLGLAILLAGVVLDMRRESMAVQRQVTYFFALFSEGVAPSGAPPQEAPVEEGGEGSPQAAPEPTPDPSLEPPSARAEAPSEPSADEVEGFTFPGPRESPEEAPRAVSRPTSEEP